MNFNVAIGFAANDFLLVQGAAHPVKFNLIGLVLFDVLSLLYFELSDELIAALQILQISLDQREDVFFSKSCVKNLMVAEFDSLLRAKHFLD